MTDIGKISNSQYHGIDKFDKNIGKEIQDVQANVCQPTCEDIKDNGVLGQSQVVADNLDNDLRIAAKHPEALTQGEMVFDIAYDTALKSGKTPEEATAYAITVENEFIKELSA